MLMPYLAMLLLKSVTSLQLQPANNKNRDWTLYYDTIATMTKTPR